MDSRHLILASICTVFVLLLAYLIFGSTGPDDRVISGSTMGTTYNVRIPGCPEAMCDALEQDIEARLAALNRQLSHYDPKSELAAFNNHREPDWFPVSPDLYNVVAFARALSRQSEGAFDITVGAAVNAWGFGPEPGERVPPDAEIRAALASIGYTKLALRNSPPALRKSVPGMTLDLSGVAKGYAVDQLAMLIESRGFDNYLVEIGGEVRASGTRADGWPWRIGLEPPDAEMPIEYIVTLGSQAIASSGDYRNYFMVDGRRYAHTLDPRTGNPVQHALAGVSIIQPSAMQADAMATLLMVLGPDAGIAFAQANELPALFFIREESGGFIVAYSEALESYLLTD
jgi:thiamine biosynthesis lipoprotein